MSKKDKKKDRTIKNNIKEKQSSIKNNIGTNGSIIKNDKILENRIVLRFSNFNLKSVRLKNDEFTNFQKDIYETHKIFSVFLDSFLKHFEKMTIEELRKEKHCHPIEGEKEKLCYKILSEYDNVKKEGITFFQFGGTKGIRAVSHKLGENVYELLFLDPHHLLYPSNKYNQKDQAKYDCCMIDLNNKSNNIKNKLEEQENKIQELEKEVKILKEKLNQQK